MEIITTFLLFYIIFMQYAYSKINVTKSYYFVIFSISILGSLIIMLNDLYKIKIKEAEIWKNSGFDHDFSYFFGVFVISLVLSLVSSSFSIIAICYFENKFKKYLLINFIVFIINYLFCFIVVNYHKERNLIESIQSVNGFFIYYLPGVVAYYFFVHRPRKKLQN